MVMANNALRLIFSTRLREERKHRGWSQEVLAAKCGLHRTYIGSVERGQRNISIDAIAQIADAMEIQAFNLLKNTDNS